MSLNRKQLNLNENNEFTIILSAKNPLGGGTSAKLRNMVSRRHSSLPSQCHGPPLPCPGRTA